MASSPYGAPVVPESFGSSSQLQFPSALLGAAPQDVERFIADVVDQFDENRELRYEHFLNMWKEFKFGLIFHGRDSYRELYEFTEDLLLLVKRRCLSPHPVADRAAAVYLLYALYFKQPIKSKIRILLSMDEFKDMHHYMEERRDNRDWDVVYTWMKMVADHAFHYAAEGRVLGIEVAMANETRAGAEKAEVFKMRENNPFDTTEFQHSLNKLASMEEMYMNMKRALQNQTGTDASQDHSLNMADSDFAAKIKNIADSVYSDPPTTTTAADANAAGPGEGNVLVAADGSHIGDRRKELRQKAFGLQRDETRQEKELRALSSGVNPDGDTESAADEEWTPEKMPSSPAKRGRPGRSKRGRGRARGRGKRADAGKDK